MDKREFWAQKPALPEYHAVTFNHPDFAAPFRLAINQFAAVTLGGNLYTPVAGQLQPPDSRSDGNATLRLAFARPVVGRQFKAALRLVAAAGSREPITVQYDVYLGDTTTPEIAWSLYVAEAGGVTFRRDTVQVLATLDNPMRADVATIYDPTVYTGLESV